MPIKDTQYYKQLWEKETENAHKLSTRIWELETENRTLTFSVKRSCTEIEILRGEREELKAEIQQRREDEPRRHLEWRGIDVEYGGAKVCKDCSGSGVEAYGSTATWRGGIGGQQITSDVCNRCWGSGDLNRPWTDIRTTCRILVSLGYNGCPDWLKCAERNCGDKERNCGECGT